MEKAQLEAQLADESFIAAQRLLDVLSRDLDELGVDAKSLATASKYAHLVDKVGMLYIHTQPHIYLCLCLRTIMPLCDLSIPFHTCFLIIITTSLLPFVISLKYPFFCLQLKLSLKKV